jgi:hypothetical protein
MVAGVLALGLALIWALLSWDPVDRSPETQTTVATAPEPAPAPTGPVVQPAAPTKPLAQAPEPPAAAPKPASDPTPSQDESTWPIPESSGPLEELKRAFDQEPRASSAVAAEAAIHTGFEGPAVKPGLLESVLCRTTVCRVRMRWTRDRALGFMAGLMYVVTDPVDGLRFDQNLAIDHPAEPNAAGERTIDVYIKLHAP